MLKIELTRKNFLSSLEPAQLIAERRSTMPILSNVLIEATTDKIDFFATDLEIGVKSSVKAEVESTGSVTIPAKKLFDFIKSLPEGVITIEEIDNFGVLIRGGNSRFKIGGLNPEEFPKVGSYDEAEFFDISPSVLSDLISYTLYAVSTDETRYNINGIYFINSGEEGEVVSVSTDGHRLSKMSGKLADVRIPIFDEGLILPRKGVSEIRKILDQDHEVSDIKISRVGNQFVVKGSDTIISMRLIDGEFPEWQDTIPAGNSNLLTINKSSLIDVLKRTLLMSSDRYHLVVFSFVGNNLTISCSNPELGEVSEFTETIEVKYDGNDLDIGFNPRYLIDASSVTNSEDVVISMGEDLDPVIVTDPDKEGFLGLVMPMRI
jgi:DNA polymerase III subunit beta